MSIYLCWLCSVIHTSYPGCNTLGLSACSAAGPEPDLSLSRSNGPQCKFQSLTYRHRTCFTALIWCIGYSGLHSSRKLQCTLPWAAAAAALHGKPQPEIQYLDIQYLCSTRHQRLVSLPRSATHDWHVCSRMSSSTALVVRTKRDITIAPQGNIGQEVRSEVLLRTSSRNGMFCINPAVRCRSCVTNYRPVVTLTEAR